MVEPPRDVYAPPDAPVSGPVATPTRGGWIAYAFVMGMWLALGVVSLARNAASLSIPALVIQSYTHIAYGLGVVGVWGYARRRPLGGRGLWIAALVLVGIQLFMLGRAIASKAVDGAGVGIVLPLAFAILLAPTALALWRYAFRSPELWAPATPKG